MRLAACVALLALALWTPNAWGHQGHSQRAPWDACEGRTLSQVCSWQDPEDALYVGTCRQVQTSLLCVRNRPIQPVPSADTQATPRRIPMGWLGVALAFGLLGFWGIRRRQEDALGAT